MSKASAAHVRCSVPASEPEEQLPTPKIKVNIGVTLFEMKKVHSVPCLSLESSRLYRRRLEGEKSPLLTPATAEVEAASEMA